MGDPLHLTILYEEGDDGWIVSSIPEVPGVLSQGGTKKEARETALAALAGMLKLRAAEYEPGGLSSAAYGGCLEALLGEHVGTPGVSYKDEFPEPEPQAIYETALRDCS